MGCPHPAAGCPTSSRRSWRSWPNPAIAWRSRPAIRAPTTSWSGRGVAQLVDYEVAAFRHALLDAAYFVLPLPNCWCWRRFPEPVLDGMLAAYRAEISPVMPSVSEDASFDAGLSRCSAAWLVFHLASRLPFVVESNRSFDLFNERERLITMLRNFARLPATPAVTPYVGEWLGRLGERFEAMWPSEAATVQLYPAFQRERPVAPAFPAQPLS